MSNRLRETFYAHLAELNRYQHDPATDPILKCFTLAVIRDLINCASTIKIIDQSEYGRAIGWLCFLSARKRKKKPFPLPLIWPRDHHISGLGAIRQNAPFGPFRGL